MNSDEKKQPVSCVRDIIEPGWREAEAARDAKFLASIPMVKKPVGLDIESIRELIDEAGLDWHNGWTVGDDAVNRYLQLVRLVEREHDIPKPTTGATA